MCKTTYFLKGTNSLWAPYRRKTFLLRFKSYEVREISTLRDAQIFSFTLIIIPILSTALFVLQTNFYSPSSLTIRYKISILHRATLWLFLCLLILVSATMIAKPKASSIIYAHLILLLLDSLQRYLNFRLYLSVST